MQAEDEAAAELGAAAVKAEEGERAYITVPDGPAMPADKQSIKGLSYTQAFGIYKVGACRRKVCLDQSRRLSSFS
jgi:hypothetical protein